MPDGEPLGPIVVHNTSEVACTLRGYFGVHLVNQIGLELSETVIHQPAPVETVELGPHGAGTASFEIESRGDDPYPACDHSKAVGISPPGSDPTADDPAWTFFSSLKVCNKTVVVTPIVAGPNGNRP